MAPRSVTVGQQHKPENIWTLGKLTNGVHNQCYIILTKYEEQANESYENMKTDSYRRAIV